MVLSCTLTTAAVVPLGLAYVFWAPPQTITFGALLVAVVLGGLGWLGMLALTRHPALGEILALASTVQIGRWRRAMPRPVNG